MLTPGMYALWQVQKLLAKHKAEIQAVQQAAAEDTRRLLDVAGAQHELAVRQLKERLAKVSNLPLGSPLLQGPDAVQRLAACSTVQTCKGRRRQAWLHTQGKEGHS